MGHNTDPAVCFYVVLFSGFLDFGKVECDFTIKSLVWPHFTSITFKYVGSCCRDSQQTQDIQLIFAQAARIGIASSEGCSQSPEIKMAAASTPPPTGRKPGEERWHQVLSSSDLSVNHQLIQTKLIINDTLQRQQAFLFAHFPTCERPQITDGL